MKKCKYLGRNWNTRLSSEYKCNTNYLVNETYYLEIVNSCNFPYAVFDKNKNCIDCFKIKDFNQIFSIDIKEIRKEKIEKLNETR
jgi:hypothetical protein